MGWLVRFAALYLSKSVTTISQTADGWRQSVQEETETVGSWDEKFSNNEKNLEFRERNQIILMVVFVLMAMMTAACS